MLSQGKNTSLFHCSISIESEMLVIARSMPQRRDRSLTPIKVGETILWDNRFKIKLQSLEQTERGKKIRVSKRMWKNQVPSAEEIQEKTFYIRHWDKSDDQFAAKGIRKVRASQLPHNRVRGGLPVILDEKKNLVVIPHYQTIDRSGGVCCECTFEPVYAIKDIIYNLS